MKTVTPRKDRSMKFNVVNTNFMSKETNRDIEITVYDKNCASHGIEIVSSIYTEKQRKLDIVSIPIDEAKKLKELLNQFEL